MINHIFYKVGETISPFPSEGRLYDYIFAANGIFIRSKRARLSVLGCIGRFKQPIAGLGTLEQQIVVPKVPWSQLHEIIETSKGRLPNEALFYGNLSMDEKWIIEFPEQNATEVSVFPIDPIAGAQALLELHSHGDLNAFFSSDDDKDERNGFRIYVVIGELGPASCSIKCRIGVFGHFVPVDWQVLFETPILPIFNVPILGKGQA
jgi:PRTRC genetic system protein A